ncbi:MAG: hypothetical protein AAGA60_21370 [Cyanobacteria bacterium P01_E01_bin.42]
MTKRIKNYYLDTASIPDIDALITYIEDNPQYSDIVEEAKNPKKTSEKENKLTKCGKNIVNLVIANPKDFYGRALVSKNLEQHSRITAGSVSVSSFFNFFMNNPLLFYAFSSFGIFSWLCALITNGLILRFTNLCATATSARKRGNRGWSNWALGGTISLNLLQSLVSGVGTELMLNQSGLSQLKAKELIEEQKARVEELKNLDRPEYEEAKALCEGGERELNSLNRGHPRWDSLYVRLYGQWGEQKKDWSRVPLEQLPVCRQSERLRTEAFKGYETAKAELEEKLLDRNRLGDDLSFLQYAFPVVHNANFKPNGSLQSGIEASRLAILLFIERFARLDVQNMAALGFPGLFLLLSLLTSGFACAMTIQHSKREDVQMSFNDAVQQQRDCLLEELRQQL